MRKSILYIAGSLDEVYQCAYSILKYLEVYNLNPPPDHSLFIYTNYPELLEAYSSFFNEFALRPIPQGSTRESLLDQCNQEASGKVLYLEANAYPIDKIDGFFAQPSNTFEGITRYKNLREFKFLLKDFFSRYQEESVPNQVKLIHNIDAKKIEKQKEQFESLPFLAKWFRKIVGKGWNISNYLVRI
jgi:hypothetical protein